MGTDQIVAPDEEIELTGEDTLGGELAMRHGHRDEVAVTKDTEPRPLPIREGDLHGRLRQIQLLCDLREVGRNVATEIDPDEAGVIRGQPGSSSRATCRGSASSWNSQATTAGAWWEAVSADPSASMTSVTVSGIRSDPLMTVWISTRSSTESRSSGVSSRIAFIPCLSAWRASPPSQSDQLAWSGPPGPRSAHSLVPAMADRAWERPCGVVGDRRIRVALPMSEG